MMPTGKKVIVTVYPTREQYQALARLQELTKVPTAERIRQGIDRVLALHAEHEELQAIGTRHEQARVQLQDADAFKRGVLSSLEREAKQKEDARTAAKAVRLAQMRLPKVQCPGCGNMRARLEKNGIVVHNDQTGLLCAGVGK